MEPKTLGNGIYAFSTSLVFSYTFAVIKYAKPLGGSNIFDQEWLEHGFCVINQDIPYMNSHDLCLYVDTVLVALGLLMHHKLKGNIDHQAMKSSDDLLLFNMLGHLGHGIAHGFIGAEFRKEGFEGAQHGTYMERAERGDEGSMIEMMIKAIALFGFWCGLLKGVAPSLSTKQLMLLSLLVGYVHLHVPSILIFGYVNAVLTVLNTLIEECFTERTGYYKTYNRKVHGHTGLALSTGIGKDMPQAIIKEASGQWLSNFSANSHGIKVIDNIPVCCELRKEEATVVELANDLDTTRSKVKSVSAVLLSAAANYKLVKKDEALDVLFASKGAQEHLRFGCSSKQAKERSIIHKPSRNKLLNDHGWMVHGENLIGRLAKMYLRNPIYTPALHKQIGVSIMNFLHAAWRHRPELLALIKSLKCTTFLLKKAGHLNLSPEEMEAAAETIRNSIKKFVDNAAQARSAVATLKNNLGTDFDMEEALTFLGDEGCKPGVLSKLEFEHDCRYARAKYVTDSAAGRDMVKIFAEIENEFGTNVLDWLKSRVEQSMAKAEFDRLSAENVDMSDDDIIDELRKMTTTVKGSKVKLFSDGTISHLKSTVAERSKAKAAYEDLIMIRVQMMP